MHVLCFFVYYVYHEINKCMKIHVLCFFMYYVYHGINKCMKMHVLFSLVLIHLHSHTIELKIKEQDFRVMTFSY